MKLTKGNRADSDILTALQIAELVTPWVFKENLYYEMAKGYQQLKNIERDRELLKEVFAKKPAFADAKKLLDEIK